jgi:hypothetical protein
MLPQILEQVTVADLQKLIDDHEQEGKFIEYKGESYRLDGTDQDFKTKQHEELLKDVSSFANESGGDLILGMKEVDGVPTEIRGCAIPDPDALKLRLTDILQKWLEPRASFAIHFVALSAGKHVFVIRVRRSLLAPHRVVYQGRFGQFWGRTSSGAYMMDTTQLRRAFLLSETIYDQMRSFVSDRIARIASGNTPVLMPKGAKLIVHLLPIESFSARLSFGTDLLNSLHMRMRPLASNRGWTPRFNLDGVITCDYSDFNQPSTCYVQIFRNGILEITADDITYALPNDSEQKLYFRTHYENYLLQRLPEYLECQRTLAIPPPIWVFVTLIGMKGVGILRTRSFTPMPPIDRDVLRLPDVEITEFPIDSFELLKPLYDMIWNAAGYPHCLSFDARKQWQPG